MGKCWGRPKWKQFTKEQHDENFCSHAVWKFSSFKSRCLFTSLSAICRKQGWSLMCSCHRSDSPLWLLVQHCTVALSLLCYIWDAQMADVWFEQHLETLVSAALQGYPGSSTASALSCLTSIASANCKAWTWDKNEIYIDVVTFLCQYVIYKPQSSASLNLTLNVSCWRVCGLKFWKGQHSTFCTWSVPEPKGLPTSRLLYQWGF